MTPFYSTEFIVKRQLTAGIKLQPSQQLGDTQLIAETASSAEQAINTPKLTIAGGLLAGIGSSACCVGPFLLRSLGIGGSWIGNLTAILLPAYSVIAHESLVYKGTLTDSIDPVKSQQAGG